MVEVQLLQVRAEHRNRGDLIVGQLQVQQTGNVEDMFGKASVTQLVTIQPHKCQMSEVFEVVSEQENNGCEETVQILLPIGI